MLDRIRVLIEKGDTTPKFLSLIRHYIPRITDHDQSMLMKACNLAESEFKHDVRLTGEAYFTHLLAVPAIVCDLGMRDVNVLTAGVLHDLIEDKPHWTHGRLAAEFNLDVADLVAAVSMPERHPNEALHEYKIRYYAQIRAKGIRAISVKLSDRLHNMLTLWGTSEKKLAKTLETLQYVLPLAVESQILWTELTLACAERISERNDVFLS